MRGHEVRDEASDVRQATLRADAMRSLMPLCTVELAMRQIIERKLVPGSTVPRGTTSQPRA